MLKLKPFFLMPVLISVVCSALMACGTKGPLYIPEQRYPQETNKPTADTSKIDAEKATPAQPITKE